MVVTTRRASQALLATETSAGEKKDATRQNGSGLDSRSCTSAATKDINSKGKKPKGVRKAKPKKGVTKAKPKGVTKTKPTPPRQVDLGIDDVVTILRESLATGSVSRKSFLPRDIPRMAGAAISPEVFNEIYQLKSAGDCGAPVNPSSTTAVNDRWDSAGSWDMSHLISAWNSLGGKIKALASVIITSAPNDKPCHFTVKGLNNWIGRLEQKDDSKVNPSEKQKTWFLEALIWHKVLLDLAPRQQESGGQSNILKSWNAWIRVYNAMSSAPPTLLSEFIKWRSASIRLFFATQGPLPTQHLDDRVMFRSLLGALEIQEKLVDKICDTGDVPRSPDVKSMADQVARQVMWVTTFMLGLELDFEVPNLPVYSPNETSNGKGILVKYKREEGEDEVTLPVRIGLRMRTIVQDEEREQTDGAKEWQFEVPDIPRV